KDAKPKNITEDNKANDTGPVYSPNGEEIAYLRQTIKFFYADLQYLVIRNRSTGRITATTDQVDHSFSRAVWHPNSNAQVRKLFLEGEYKGEVSIGVTAFSKGWVERLTAFGSDRMLEISRSPNKIVFARSSFNRPAATYTPNDGPDVPPS